MRMRSLLNVSGLCRKWLKFLINEQKHFYSKLHSCFRYLNAAIVLFPFFLSRLSTSHREKVANREQMQAKYYYADISVSHFGVAKLSSDSVVIVPCRFYLADCVFFSGVGRNGVGVQGRYLFTVLRGRFVMTEGKRSQAKASQSMGFAPNNSSFGYSLCKGRCQWNREMLAAYGC